MGPQTSTRFRLLDMADSLYHQPTMEEANVLRDLSTKMRIHSIKMTAASKSGHPTSCSSMAEVMSVLFFKVMKYKDPRVHKEQRDPANDRFILSKGHAAPILYAAWAGAGLFPVSDLTNLRKIDSDLEGHPTPIKDSPNVDITGVTLADPPAYNVGDKLATRQAYGKALAKLAKNNTRVVALDGDMKNSTFSQEILKVDKNRFIECFICEQNMLGVGIGIACRDRSVAFASTFAAFLTRGFDNLRMGVISQTNLNVVGSHCGVSIGEDGPSQMALEDIAMFRSLPGCTVFYPSDGVSMERATELAANTQGVTFIRA